MPPAKRIKMADPAAPSAGTFDFNLVRLHNMQFRDSLVWGQIRLCAMDIHDGFRNAAYVLIDRGEPNPVLDYISTYSDDQALIETVGVQRFRALLNGRCVHRDPCYTSFLLPVDLFLAAILPPRSTPLSPPPLESTLVIPTPPATPCCPTALNSFVEEGDDEESGDYTGPTPPLSEAEDEDNDEELFFQLTRVFCPVTDQEDLLPTSPSKHFHKIPVVSIC